MKQVVDGISVTKVQTKLHNAPELLKKFIESLHRPTQISFLRWGTPGLVRARKGDRRLGHPAFLSFEGSALAAD
jgi:hypothetical protein